MALNLDDSPISLNAVRIIASADDAIDKEKSDWDAYKDVLDEKHLVFVAGKAPTVFVCNFQLGAKEARMVNNAMLGTKDDTGKPSLAYGSWAQTIAKVCLKDIQNPADVPEIKQLRLRKDASGYVHDELLAKLERAGVVDDVFSAFVNLTKNRTGVDEAKNS